MSYLSDFEHTKLDARVYPGFVIQTQYVSDPITGQRRVPKEKVWKVERLLGKGGFGEVRLEVHLEENEKRAVKRMWATGSSFKREYERELKALLEFSKPKYKESAVFVEFLGWFEDAECVYLAMEYVPLGDLEENVQAIGGTVKETEVRDITIQILEGLKIMHLENFAHRDLKPKNVLVCKGPPHWWIKLADFGVSKHRTEETAYRTQTGTQAYMAPEILNYVPGVNPKSSEYTNAVDIWALGCMVYRLVNGVVPFPPGPSLLNFCGDESKFPSQGSALSELGATFVRELVVPYPSRRITAQQALDHTWIKAHSNGSEVENPPVPSDFKGSESSTAHPTTPIKRNGLDSVASFGGYNTVTHAGLQSYGPAASTERLNPVHAESGRPKGSYHPPTVEDEEDGEDEATGAHGLEANIALDQRQGQSLADPVPPVKADTHGVSDEAEAPDVTIKRSHRKSDNFSSTRPKVTSAKRKLAKRADPEQVSPELSDSSSVPSWDLYSNDSNSPQPQSRQTPEPTGYIVDSRRSVPTTAPHHSDVRGVEEGSSTRRSKSPKSRRAWEPTSYLINNGRTILIDAQNRPEQLRDEEEASNASDRNEPPPPAGVREPTRYKIDNGRSVPVTSRHRAELRDSNEASHTRDRSVSPPIPPTRSSRRYYSGPFSYEEEWGSPFPSLTLDNLNKLAAEYEPNDSADCSSDAISNLISETGAVYKFRPTASPFSDQRLSPTPSSDPLVKATSAGRRVYFADERGYVDSVPERLANRRGDILQAPPPPTWQEMVAEWQEDVARNLADHPAEVTERPPLSRGEKIRSGRPKIPPRDGGSSRKSEGPLVGDVKYSSTYYNTEEDPVPEPIIYTARPKMPSRDKGSSRRDTDLNGQPLFGDVKYARNYDADQVIYGSNPDRYRGEINPNNQQGSAPLYDPDVEPEPIIYSARPKATREHSKRSGSGRKAKPLYGQPKNTHDIGVENVIYSPILDRYKGDDDLNDPKGPARNQEPEPIIYTPQRPKMSPREGGSSRKPATSRDQPLYAEVKYAPRYSAEDVFYAPVPDASKRDGDSNDRRGAHRGEKNPTVYA